MTDRDVAEVRQATPAPEISRETRTMRASCVRVRGLAVLAAATFLILPFLLAACSSESPRPFGPSGLALEFSQAGVQVTDAIIVTAFVTDAREDPPAIDWYVNGHPGGSDSTGFITSTNPATFTAPDAIPAGGAVVIEARLADDPSVRAEETLPILFTVHYVDAASGDDVSGTGARTAPLRTVTAALQEIATGDTVRVAPGVYGPHMGEDVPFDIPPGVALMGSHRDSCFLEGGHWGAVVELGDSATVAGFTVVNPQWCDVGVRSSAAGWIRAIRINDRFDDVAVRSEGAASTVIIENCEFVNTDDPGAGRGLKLIFGSTATVRGCEVRGWRTGLWLNRDSAPLIELCEITGNTFGLETEESSVYFTSPDLGGGARGSVGGNTIAGNEYVDLVTRTPAYIYANFNIWDGFTPTECLEVLDGCDIAITNNGAVEWCLCFGAARADQAECSLHRIPFEEARSPR